LTVFFYLIIHKKYCKHESSKSETLVDFRYGWTLSADSYCTLRTC